MKKKKKKKKPLTKGRIRKCSQTLNLRLQIVVKCQRFLDWFSIIGHQGRAGDEQVVHERVDVKTRGQLKDEGGFGRWFLEQDVVMGRFNDKTVHVAFFFWQPFHSFCTTINHKCVYLGWAPPFFFLCFETKAKVVRTTTPGGLMMSMRCENLTHPPLTPLAYAHEQRERLIDWHSGAGFHGLEIFEDVPTGLRRTTHTHTHTHRKRD